jgi:uncharacterized protein (TIGR02246 family)
MLQSFARILARTHTTGIACLTLLALLCFVPNASAAQLNGEVQAASEAFVKAFNDGKPESIVALFVADGELVDENGNLYKGKDELQRLFADYFGRFPGATLSVEVESIRVIGSDLAVEDGTRHLSTKDSGKAQVRYSAVRTKKDGKWLIASIREFFDEPAPTHTERLDSLGWLIGDWVSEDNEMSVKLSYRWAEDKNFLLGDFHVVRGGEVLMKSTQRIGWDPVAGKVRSWLFDADGGFAEGSWTNVDGSWVIKSQATNPDGTTGSATVTFAPKGRSQFVMRGTDRIIGDERGEDFEVTVTRAPPSPTGKAPPTGKPAPAGTPSNANSSK